MSKRGENEGVLVLDDFICEALSDPAVPRADPRNQGRNEGMHLLQDLVVDKDESDRASAGAEPSFVAEFVQQVLVIHSTQSQLDEQDSDRLMDVVRDRGAKTILLNLRGVDFISALFLARLIGLREQLQSAGGQLVLCHLGGQVQEVASLLRLTHLFPIYSSQEQALQTG